MDDADALLVDFLDAQRGRVLLVVDGLAEEQLRRPVVPSGWSVLGLIEHLAHAERHWFEQVALGRVITPLPWPPTPYDPEAPFLSDHPVEEVLEFYRATVTAAQQLLASTPLTVEPLGDHGQGAADQVTTLRYVVLHMVEETARHLGHLDVARELLDGRTGLGPDPL